MFEGGKSFPCHPMWFQCFLFRWCKFPVHLCPWACLTGELITFRGCKKEKRNERTPWKAQVPPPAVSNIVQLPNKVLVGVPQCFFTYSSIIPTKTSIGFSPTPWNILNLWCGTQWSLLMLLLIPWFLLYLPAACYLCLKFNSSSCCSSSALFQSTVSSCKHKKNFECKRTTKNFGCG
jgi:hypothetical protein